MRLTNRFRTPILATFLAAALAAPAGADDTAAANRLFVAAV